MNKTDTPLLSSEDLKSSNSTATLLITQTLISQGLIFFKRRRGILEIRIILPSTKKTLQEQSSSVCWVEVEARDQGPGPLGTFMDGSSTNAGDHT